MSYFLNMSTRKKLIILSIIFQIVIASISLWTYRNSLDLSEKTNYMYNKSFAAATSAAETKADLNGVRALLVTMIAEPDKTKLDKHKHNIENITKTINDRLNKIINNKALPQDMIEDFKKINEPWSAFRDTRDKELIPAIYEGDIEKAKGLALGVQAERYKRFIELSTDLIEKANEESQEKVKYSIGVSQNIKNVFISIFVISLIINFTINIIVLKYMVNPLTKGVALAEAIADGDLTKRIDASALNRDDEIGHLMKSFDKMSNSLNEFLASVVSSSSQIASASEQLSASATQIAKGTQTQTERATTVAASAEEMSATVIEVAKNASGASESAKESNKLSQKGKTTVERTVEGMNGIAQSVEESASVITQLGTRSNEIGEIIKVIDDIADQTNLLALNAAIEAARAGEHGRGFAVVADEVRKLAEKTTKATKEIGGMISTIQDETGKAVTSMGEVTKEVNEEVKQARDAGDALNEIAANVDKLTGLIQQIAVASEEQSAATDTISRDIQDIANTTKETSSSSTQIADASNDLAKLATDLQGMLSKFKVRSA